MTTLTAQTDAPQVLRFSVGNLNCGGCAARAERALSGIDGVERAVVNFATRRADVRGAGLSEAHLSEIMQSAGYPIAPVDTAKFGNSDQDGDSPHAIRAAFLLALLLTLPVFVTEMGGHVFPAFHHWLHGLIGETLLRWGQGILSLAVLAGPGRVFFVRGIPALLRRAPEMNALVALGAGTAWLWSAAVTVAPGLVPAEGAHVYFEAAAVIVTLILLGRWLEARARGQAGAAIAGLMELAPDTAVRVGPPDIEVPLDQVLVGDLLRLRPGARVPVDGTVEEGASDVDEAMLTGEPIPVAKGPGATVAAGTVNGSGTLTIRASAVGAETALGRIVGMVEDAQAMRLPVQALVNRVTAVFVPVVIVIACLAGLIWWAFAGDPGRAMVTLVSVLIIACPCAMGLATPVSVLAGTGRAAEVGILFRRGDALQSMGQVDLVAFDKTGTLTEGRPEILSFDGDETAYALAASVERASEHPLARAIVAGAQKRALPLSEVAEFCAHPGGGVTAQVGGTEVRLGTAAFLRGENIDVPGPEGTTTEVHVALDGRHRGRFRFADAAKPDAADAVAAMGQAGMRVAILSGDSPSAVDRLAGEIGVTEAQGALTPEAKQAKVAAWQAEGMRVAFVGDGINDAPVLAAADVGVAVGTGTDIAIEAAEVILTNGAPSGVARAIEVSRRTLSNIRQNLVWAFAYNVALIPVAAGVLVPFGGPGLNPMLGAGAMAASSVLVVANALRLRRL